MRASLRRATAATTVDRGLQLVLAHLRTVRNVQRLRFVVELVARASTRTVVRAQATATAGRNVVSGKRGALARLTCARALFVHRAGGNLFRRVLVASMLFQAFFDVLVLPLTLGTPTVLRHDASPLFVLFGLFPGSSGLKRQCLSAQNCGVIPRIHEGGRTMAHVHDHGHGHTDTIIEEREGTSAALIVAIVLVLIGFMVWLFGFSNIVFTHNTNRPPATTFQNNTTNNTNGGTTRGSTKPHTAGRHSTARRRARRG